MHQTRTPAAWLNPAAAVLAMMAMLAGGCGTEVVDGTRPSATLSISDQSRQRLVIAQSALRAGDKEKALAELTKAIEINPTFVPAHMAVADIYRMDKNYAMAEPAYARAADLEPSNFDAQYFDGLMLQMLGRVTDAIRMYNRALRLRQDDFKTTLNLSAAYYSLEEDAQALAFGKRAVELRPNDGNARLNLGAIYASMDKHREAVKEFQQAAETELTPTLLMNLAESLGRLQRYEEMKNTLQQLVKMQDSAAAQERLGFACFGLRQYEEAQGAFERSLAIDPNYTPALNGLGVICMNRFLLSDSKDTDARDRACQAWRHSLRIDKNQQKIVELYTRYCGN